MSQVKHAKDTPGFLAPIGVDSFFQPRRVAFWVMVFFIANGLFFEATQLLTAYRIVPTAVLFGIVVWTLYTIPVLLFFRSLDLFEQHPPLGYVLAFAWGGFAATYLAISANSAIFSLASKVGGPQYSADWGAALAGPSVEETLKVLGVVLLVLVARNQFPTLLSVVATGAMVGLGFQVLEDLSYSINTAIVFPNDNEVLPVALMLGTRGIISGIWSHAMYTSISAFGIGYFLTRRHKPFTQRLAVAVAAFAAAWTLHFFWNSPFFTDLGFLPSVLIKAIPVAVVGYLIWRLAGKEEGIYLKVLADHFVADDLVTPEEREALPSLRRRRHARTQVKKAKGRTAAKALHELQREQVRLVMHHGRYGAGTKLADHEYAVRRARARLNAMTSGHHVEPQ
ncbi:PrsW family intramembrane metalloprotease [Saccharothrix longispora]|uniref:RsiW-degrading membrane proteinase PrsW (M82 family) n=1 Tax=Saccharothrix longispora TaxID=33920 RepID=A0ABU1PTF2_9PSEU|nr:PrsW family glutamic-type intramembrane protease [Saccharothrix longispora]MDR6593548.1 RsiW-degrading membrane proteinase PrsW (M82 family) [Saccharothrix longispora]